MCSDGSERGRGLTVERGEAGERERSVMLAVEDEREDTLVMQ